MGSLGVCGGVDYAPFAGLLFTSGKKINIWPTLLHDFTIFSLAYTLWSILLDNFHASKVDLYTSTCIFVHKYTVYSNLSGKMN